MEANTRQAYKLETYLAGTSNSIIVLLVSELEIAAYRTLLTKVKEGIAVDLIILSSQLDRLGLTDHFLTNFRVAGGRLFLIDETQVDWHRLKISRRNCILADENHLLLATSNKPGKLTVVIDERIITIQSALNKLRQLALLVPHTLENGPLIETNSSGLTGNNWLTTAQIYFSASTNLVLGGETTKLSWSAPQADWVDIHPGPRKLPPQGSRAVKISRPTEFILTVYQGGKSVSKVCTVKVAELPSIYYYLSKTTENGEERLKGHPELAHHFGIIKGEPVTLNWEAHHVKSIEIELNDQQLPPEVGTGEEAGFQRGQRQFSVDDQQRIIIKARGKRETIEQEIVIKAFIIPEPELRIVEPTAPSKIVFTQFTKWLKQ